MPRNAAPPPDWRHTALTLFEVGWKQTQIAQKVKKSQSTVSRLISTWEKNDRRLLPRKGHNKRKRKWRYHHNTLIWKIVCDTNAHALSLAQITAIFNSRSQTHVSATTMRVRLILLGIKARIPLYKPLMTDRHAAARVDFCLRYRNWTLKDWAMMIWSDETSIVLGKPPKRSHVWTHRGDRLLPCNVNHSTKYQGKPLMVWGCFAGSQRGLLLEVKRSINSEAYQEVLTQGLLPFLEQHKQNEGSDQKLIFMHDNAPAHASASTKTWLEAAKVAPIRWPAQSPDLNPIENVWRDLKHRVKARQPTRKELPAVVQEEWTNMNGQYFQRFLTSMPRRIAQCLKNRGFYTDF